MVHTFELDGTAFCYDVESGSLYEVDKLTRALVDRREGREASLFEYGEAEIAEAQAEIDALEREGHLFVPQKEIRVSTYSGEIKSLCLNVCHDCQLRCAYCFADEGKYRGHREMMSAEVARNAVDFLIEKSGRRHNLEMDFFGGEPLMNLNVVRDTVAYAKQRANACGKEFKFTLTTNALLLNEDIIRFLNEEMDNVVLSIDGRKEVHDAVRKTAGGKGSFDVALKNAKAFRAERGEKSYYVRGTFTALNTDFCKDVLFLNDCGFDQISLEPVVLPENHRLALKKSHLAAVNMNYEALAKEYVLRRREKDKWFNFFHFFVDLEGGPCLKKRLMGCSAGNEYLAVAPNGDIYPCHQFVGDGAYRMGNVFDKNVDENVKRRFAGANLTTKPTCSACFARYHCSGGCAANNLHFNGDIDRPYELSCEMMRKRLECALYVYAREKAEN